LSTTAGAATDEDDDIVRLPFSQMLSAVDEARIRLCEQIRDVPIPTVDGGLLSDSGSSTSNSRKST
jgi:hypothetical protein